MPRRIRSSQLETRSARLKLPTRRRPFTVRISPGVRLGYRRNDTTGSWSVLVANGAGGAWMKVFAIADDHDDADGDRVLDYWQAQDRARTVARGSDEGNGDRPITVGEALDFYADDLAARDGETGNISRVRFHLPPSLASKTVALLTMRECRRWRDGLLAKGLTPATVKRTSKPLTAALNLAASADPRISNSNAWKVGLKALPDSHRARNVVLTDDQVRKLVALAYERDHGFGMLIEVAAVSGARVSQIGRLEVRDLLPGAKLAMPSSKKGRGHKRVERCKVPIPASLAVTLKQAAAGRSPDEPLLLRSQGRPWTKTRHTEPFTRIARKVGLDPKVVTMYSLRHSYITRSLLCGIPIRIVAHLADTSVSQIEQTYSRHIGDHSDAMVRRSLLDLGAPAAGNVLTLR